MSSKRLRREPNSRREEIITAALELSKAKGFNNFSSIDLAKALACGHSVIFHYFPNMDALRKAVMELAIASGSIKVVLDGLICQDITAMQAPEHLKESARLLLK